MKTMLVLFALSLGTAKAGEIAVIGVDSKGNEKIVNIKDDQVRSEIVEVMNYVSKEVVQKVGDVKTAANWKLDKFSVGLGLEGEIGLGPWKIGAAVKQRLFYSH